MIMIRHRILVVSNNIKYEDVRQNTWKYSICKLEDGFQRPNIDVDAFATTFLNQGVTLTFDLWPPSSNQVISRG